MPPFHPLHFPGVEIHSMEKHQKWALTPYDPTTNTLSLCAAFSPQSAIFTLCWFLSIFHLIYEDKTSLFFTPIPFASISSSTLSLFYAIIPPSLPPPSFHPLHGREHRRGQTWRLHLGPAGWLRWRTAPPEWRSDAVLRCDAARLALIGRA